MRKEYSVRKTELLDIAEKLFLERGYQESTVQEIINRARIAKGTFYHYFNSKEQLLDVLVQRQIEQVSEKIKTITNDKDLNAYEKMNMVFEHIQQWKIDHAEVYTMAMEMVFSEGNLLLKDRMFQKNFEVLTPSYTQIIKQGMEQGLFKVQDAAESAEVLNIMARGFKEYLVGLIRKYKKKNNFIAIIRKKVSVFEKAIERVLGASRGSIIIIPRRFLQ